MPHCETRGMPDNHQAVLKVSEADDSCLSVLLSLVFDLGSQTVEDLCSVLEVKATVGQGPVELGRIVDNAHRISVYTLMRLGNGAGTRK